MSAWKKPSRMAWRRKERSTVRPSALRSWPAARSAAWSAIGMPSIHSSVSTRRAVRRQSTVGHAEAAELGQSLIAGDVVGHLGDGGGLQPHVHLDLDRARQRVDHGHGPQPARRRMEALDLAGGEEVAVEVAAGSASRCRGAGSSPPPRGARRCRSPPPCAPGRWRRRPPAGRTRRSGPPAGRRAPPRRPGAPRVMENGGSLSCRWRRSPASSGPIRSARVARNWPSLM